VSLPFSKGDEGRGDPIFEAGAVGGGVKSFLLDVLIPHTAMEIIKNKKSAKGYTYRSSTSVVSRKLDSLGINIAGAIVPEASRETKVF
jgi:hypothetical protein